MNRKDQRPQLWPLVIAVLGAIGLMVLAHAARGCQRSVVKESVFLAPPPPTRAPPRPKPSTETDGREATAVSKAGPSSDPDRSTLEEEIERLLQEAVNAPIPEEGIAQVTEYLAQLDQVAEASRLYAALATLYMKSSPTPPDIVQELLARAAAVAINPEDRLYAARVEAEILQQCADANDALARVREALQADNVETLDTLQLRLMQGDLEERKGDLVAAEAAYKELTKRSWAARETLGPRAADLYRLACLRLARLYRKTGRDREADTLARTVRTRLGGS